MDYIFPEPIQLYITIMFTILLLLVQHYMEYMMLERVRLIVIKIRFIIYQQQCFPTFYGFYITTGTSNSVYNNFVSDLKAPSSASLTGLVGMYVSGGTSIGLYYNTIFLNATSVGANFSASGIYASTTPTVDLRNNIVVNSSTPNGYRISNGL